MFFYSSFSKDWIFYRGFSIVKFKISSFLVLCCHNFYDTSLGVKIWEIPYFSEFIIAIPQMFTPETAKEFMTTQNQKAWNLEFYSGESYMKRSICWNRRVQNNIKIRLFWAEKRLVQLSKFHGLRIWSHFELVFELVCRKTPQSDEILDSKSMSKWWSIKGQWRGGI